MRRCAVMHYVCCFEYDYVWFNLGDEVFICLLLVCLLKMSYVCYYGGLFIMWDRMNSRCMKCFLDIVVFCFCWLFSKNLKKRDRFLKPGHLLVGEIKNIGSWSDQPIPDWTDPIPTSTPIEFFYPLNRLTHPRYSKLKIL